jgi:hypothetical protein
VRSYGCISGEAKTDEGKEPSEGGIVVGQQEENRHRGIDVTGPTRSQEWLDQQALHDVIAEEVIELMAERMKQDLREYLTEATELVWKSQNCISESSDAQILREVAVYSERLHEVSNVIRGIIARWQLMEKSETGEPHETSLR